MKNSFTAAKFPNIASLTLNGMRDLNLESLVGISTTLKSLYLFNSGMCKGGMKALSKFLCLSELSISANDIGETIEALSERRLSHLNLNLLTINKYKKGEFENLCSWISESVEVLELSLDLDKLSNIEELKELKKVSKLYLRNLSKFNTTLIHSFLERIIPNMNNLYVVQKDFYGCDKYLRDYLISTQKCSLENDIK